MFVLIQRITETGAKSISKPQKTEPTLFTRCIKSRTDDGLNSSHKFVNNGSNSQKVMNFSRADEALKKVVPSTRFKLAP